MSAESISSFGRKEMSGHEILLPSWSSLTRTKDRDDSTGQLFFETMDRHFEDMPKAASAPVRVDFSGLSTSTGGLKEKSSAHAPTMNNGSWQPILGRSLSLSTGKSIGDNLRSCNTPPTCLTNVNTTRIHGRTAGPSSQAKKHTDPTHFCLPNDSDKENVPPNELECRFGQYSEVDPDDRSFSSAILSRTKALEFSKPSRPFAKTFGDTLMEITPAMDVSPPNTKSSASGPEQPQVKPQRELQGYSNSTSSASLGSRKPKQKEWESDHTAREAHVRREVYLLRKELEELEKDVDEHVQRCRIRRPTTQVAVKDSRGSSCSQYIIHHTLFIIQYSMISSWRCKMWF